MCHAPLDDPTDAAVDAHHERVHVVFTQWIPTHGARRDDPNRRYFAQARARLKRAGKLICWRCGGTTNIHLHHSACEWCSINGVDIGKFAAHFPELLPAITQEAFERAIASEGGLLPLCQPCHTGKGTGIHYIPYPVWLLGAYWKAGLPPPAAAPTPPLTRQPNRQQDDAQ